MVAIDDSRSKVKEEDERVTELEGEKVRRDENARVERKRRREEKREERRRKRREENKSEAKSERKRERQNKEEGWSEEEWCRLLGGGQEDEEESRQVGSERAVVQARNPIYRPRHTQSLADLF